MNLGKGCQVSCGIQHEYLLLSSNQFLIPNCPITNQSCEHNNGQRTNSPCVNTQCANIGPADFNYDETISTLRYANRAKNIKNRAHVNEDPKDALLRQFQLEIEELRKQLEDVGVPHNGKRLIGFC